MLECENGSLYCGITNNLEKRWRAHVSGKGAKFCRANKPVSIVFTETQPSKSDALKREYAIK